MFLLPKCVLELYILFKTIKNFRGRGLEVKILRPEISNEMYSRETHFGNKNIGSTMFRFKVISVYNNKNRSRPRCISHLIRIWTIPLNKELQKIVNPQFCDKNNQKIELSSMKKLEQVCLNFCSKFKFRLI